MSELNKITIGTDFHRHTVEFSKNTRTPKSNGHKTRISGGLFCFPHRTPTTTLCLTKRESVLASDLVTVVVTGSASALLTRRKLRSSATRVKSPAQPPVAIPLATEYPLVRARSPSGHHCARRPCEVISAQLRPCDADHVERPAVGRARGLRSPGSSRRR